LHAAYKSQIAEFALEQFAKVYDIEREVKELNVDQRQALRQQHSKPMRCASQVDDIAAAEAARQLGGGQDPGLQAAALDCVDALHR
jgi:hypothetical protein